MGQTSALPSVRAPGGDQRRVADRAKPLAGAGDLGREPAYPERRLVGQELTLVTAIHWRGSFGPASDHGR